MSAHVEVSSPPLVFGPVPSRRLGRSIGINNIPPKVCSFACVYCQVGPTLDRAVDIRAFHEPQRIAEVQGQARRRPVTGLAAGRNQRQGGLDDAGGDLCIFGGAGKLGFVVFAGLTAENPA